MGHKRKKGFGSAHTMPVEVLERSSTDDITLEQYTKGFQVFSTSGSIPEVLAATGMSRRQFEYLLSNGLAEDPVKHPSYYQRFAEVATEMRMHGVESATIISAGAKRNLRNRDNVAKMAEVMMMVLVENRAKELVKNQKLDPNDPAWKPNHKLTFTSSETSTLRILERLANYSKLGDTFERIYERANATVRHAPKGSKVEFDLDPENALPAVISTRAQVAEAQEQGEDDFHQQLFRDFENQTEEEIEAFLSEGKMPDSEQFSPTKNEDLPGDE